MSKKDPYAHRSHRQKYKLGYGAEGAARKGESEMPHEAEEAKPALTKPKSKKKPNPY